MIARMSSGRYFGLSLARRARMRLMTSPARLASRTIRFTASRASSSFGRAVASQSNEASALATTAPRVWLISWAMEAASAPNVVCRVTRDLRLGRREIRLGALALADLCRQLGIGRLELLRPVGDALLELLVELLYFLLGLPELGRLDELPISFSAREGELEGAHHVQEADRPAAAERVGEQ